MEEENKWTTPDDKKEEALMMPKYGYYHTQETSFGEADPEATRKGTKYTSGKKESFGKRLLKTAASAVVFGVVASLVFQGTNQLLQGTDTQNTVSDSSEQAASVQKAELVTTEEGESAASAQEEAADDASAVQAGTEAADTSSSAQEETDSSESKGVVADVAQAAMPSVVAITTVSVQEIRDWFGGTHQYASEGSGSGIIVGENETELLIATNNHVVSGATNLNVFFYGTDVTAESGSSSEIDTEEAVSGSIKGTDSDVDLAVVAVKKSDIPSEIMSQIKIANLGDSDELVVGEQVVAIGNALGYGQSVTSGWVSALNRSLTMSDGVASDLIQTDAAINPGNSGGALLNMKGELIGINSAKYADQAVEGMGYAIPLSRALPILQELMNRETREIVDASQASYLGVSFTDISSEAMEMYSIPNGAFIMEVLPQTAAEAGGLQKGDILVKLGDYTISSGDDLSNALQYYAAGEEVSISYMRSSDGTYQEYTIQVTLGSQP